MGPFQNYIFQVAGTFIVRNDRGVVVVAGQGHLQEVRKCTWSWSSSSSPCGSNHISNGVSSGGSWSCNGVAHELTVHGAPLGKWQPWGVGWPSTTVCTEQVCWWHVQCISLTEYNSVPSNIYIRHLGWRILILHPSPSPTSTPLQFKKTKALKVRLRPKPSPTSTPLQGKKTKALEVRLRHEERTGLHSIKQNGWT